MKVYIFALVACLIGQAMGVAMTWFFGGECTHEGSVAISITDTDTLGDYEYGWNVYVDTGEYCTHDHIYDYSITYTFAGDDEDADYIIATKEMQLISDDASLQNGKCI